MAPLPDATQDKQTKERQKPKARGAAATPATARDRRGWRRRVNSQAGCCAGGGAAKIGYDNGVVAPCVELATEIA